MNFDELFLYQIVPNVFYISLVLYLVVMFYARYLKSEKKNNIEKIKKYTLEFCFQDKNDYNSILSDLKYSNEIKSRVLFFNVLNHFEKIAIGVENHVFDEEIIFSYYSIYFMLFYKEFRYFAVEENSEVAMRYFSLEKIVQHYSNYDNKRYWRD
ncbi:DUF4760 domain-containing protein [Fusibacter ferrireducens]|uniref:DUF4760 domain-containing protein n=1 Tax=Fusibacter ferrireducens TaxID=2785058 RepID=A0ABR9ZNH5_9FIRM|nr:hypothetical protein [Fusibacter ferrireducens]MBF4692023.1 hypothetical protein [Fusibacter ferrireducens]